MPTGPIELLQTSMELYGTLWAPMDYYELLWTHMNPYGLPWVPMDSQFVSKATAMTVTFQLWRKMGKIQERCPAP